MTVTTTLRDLVNATPRTTCRADFGKASDSSPGWDAFEGNNWRVTLRRGGRQMSLDFYTGSAAGEPDAESVMECLLSDACNLFSFEDWCENYGYDTDSRKAEATYKAVVVQTAKLRKFLGADFETFADSDR